MIRMDHDRPSGQDNSMKRKDVHTYEKVSRDPARSRHDAEPRQHRRRRTQDLQSRRCHLPVHRQLHDAVPQ